ncbi:MAG: hypothetical protein IPJ24_17535 [bacterium]|nr:hypothetical protein [bacterium]
MKRRRFRLLAALAVATASIGAANAVAGELADRFGARVEELCSQKISEPIRITSSSVATRPDDGVRFLKIAIRANQERDVVLRSAGMSVDAARQAIQAVVRFLQDDETISGVGFSRLNGTEAPDSLQVNTSSLKDGPPGGRVFLVIPADGALEAKETGRWYS